MATCCLYGLFIQLLEWVVISFSIMFNSLFNILPNDPIPLTITRRLVMSAKKGIRFWTVWYRLTLRDFVFEVESIFRYHDTKRAEVCFYKF